MSTYPAGTVATATVCGKPNVKVMRCELQWVSAVRVNGHGSYADRDVTDVQPLIVLDPEDVNSFASIYQSPSGTAGYVARLIREQIAPPRIEEPGWGGVVEAGPESDREQWLRTGNVWRCRDGCRQASEWRHLTNPTLIRPGIEATR
jgi:hypothetical protein